jgi:hypothetical protein
MYPPLVPRVNNKGFTCWHKCLRLQYSWSIAKGRDVLGLSQAAVLVDMGWQCVNAKKKHCSFFFLIPVFGWRGAFATGSFDKKKIP